MLKRGRSAKIHGPLLFAEDYNSGADFLSFRRNRTGRGDFIWDRGGYEPDGFKIRLYRFLRDNIPLLSSCIWTWSRLLSAPASYEIAADSAGSRNDAARSCLEELGGRIYPHRFHRLAGLESFLPFLFDSLLTDGVFAGFVIIERDGSAVERFLPIDPIYLVVADGDGGQARLLFRGEQGDIPLGGSDLYYFGLGSNVGRKSGRSILASVPFVAYIEQQLISDMQKTIRNAGYHRLHVQVTPPERLSGESDDAYIDRINGYFDETVRMVKGCNPEDNPVTWDNVKIDYIGPGQSRAVTNSWFLSHRAMVEAICAGTNLSPFMLGYSYGTTHNWAQFKYDLVMRQVASIQRQVARFMEWIGNIELALKGFDCRCRFVFDNRLTYLAGESAEVESARVRNLIELFKNGLIPEEEARARAGELI